jgi:hypothetical protein
VLLCAGPQHRVIRSCNKLVAIASQRTERDIPIQMSIHPSRHRRCNKITYHTHTSDCCYTTMVASAVVVVRCAHDRCQITCYYCTLDLFALLLLAALCLLLLLLLLFAAAILMLLLHLPARFCQHALNCNQLISRHCSISACDKASA